MNTMRLFILPVLLSAAFVSGCARSDAATQAPASPAPATAPASTPTTTTQVNPTPAPASAPPGGGTSETAPVTTPQPATNAANTSGAKTPAKTQFATFGAGCFWGVEETFRTVKGVVKTEVGYEGGTMEKPTYHDVCTDETGHAEVVRLEFDPAVVSYDQLLSLFWRLHDPTQVNRQGPDHGTQYRTVIFYHSPEQKAAAEASKKKLGESGRWKKPIATLIEPAQTFWKAEDYHQQYFFKRGMPGCHVLSDE